MVFSHVLVPLNGSEPLELIIPHVQAMIQGGLAMKVTFLCPVEEIGKDPDNIVRSSDKCDVKACGLQVTDSK